MDEIHAHKTKKSICAHFAESPCKCTDGVITTFTKFFHHFTEYAKQYE